MAGISIGQIQRVVSSIASELSPTGSARTTVRETARLFGASRCVLAFFDADGRTEAVTRYVVGAAIDDAPSLHADEQFLQDAFAESRPIAREPDDVLDTPAVAVPCRPGMSTVGALAIYHGTPERRLDGSDVDALSHIASVSAIIIENARLGDVIQESVRADEDLSEKWQGLIDASPDEMIYVVGEDGRVLDVNRAACRALGYTRHELLHRTIANLVPSPSGQEDIALLQELTVQIMAGNVTRFESAFMTKSGRVLPIAVRIRPVEIDGQRAMVSAATDLSERKGAETQLVQTQRLRALGEMAAGVVHDINNMLTAALGPIEIILASNNDRVTRDLLPGVQQALLDGAQTVRRIQDFARQSQTGRTAFGRADLTAIAKDVVELIRPRWQTQGRQQGIALDVAIHATGPNVVWGNPVELRELLVNVVNNAIDAMPEGGRVDITAENRGSSAILRIADTGVGMPSEVVQRIFDPFYTTKGIHGSGLGLSVVYGIVARHHGEISVDSSPGKGTTFTMVFPAAAPEAEPSGPDGVFDEAAAMLEPTARPLNVLVVDDQPQVAAVLKLMLELDGHQVQLYTSGSSAVAALGDLPWDLVCTDIDMPGMSGWEVARVVKDTYPQLPVVVVTGWSERYSPSELKERGVDSVLSKPYQISNIRDLTKQIRNGFLA